MDFPNDLVLKKPSQVNLRFLVVAVTPVDIAFRLWRMSDVMSAIHIKKGTSLKFNMETENQILLGNLRSYNRPYRWP